MKQVLFALTAIALLTTFGYIAFQESDKIQLQDGETVTPSVWQYQHCLHDVEANPACGLKCDPKDHHCIDVQNKFYACRGHNQNCLDYMKWFADAQADWALPSSFYACNQECGPADVASNFGKYFHQCDVPCSAPVPAL